MLLCQNLINGPVTIKAPNTFKTEEEWLTHTIDSLLERLDAIRAQKSIQNKPSTSSASQSCEITLPAPASEHTNESRKLNSASAMPSNVQYHTSAAQSDESEMDPEKSYPWCQLWRGSYQFSSNQENCPWSPSQWAGWHFRAKGGRKGRSVKDRYFLP